MIINTNMASLNTVRQLGVNEKATQSSLAKLSSGLKINTAADDAAGLAISEKMRGQISGLNQASSNAQNGISMVATAEGSLNETTSILQRMRELAVSASNDTNTTTDRTAMQTEMNQLTSEVNRIGNTTQFNTQNLLKGDGKVNLTATGIAGMAGNLGTTLAGADISKTQANAVITMNNDMTSATNSKTVVATLNGIALTATYTTNSAANGAAGAAYGVTSTAASINGTFTDGTYTTTNGTAVGSADLAKAFQGMIDANSTLKGQYTATANTSTGVITIKAVAGGTFDGSAGNTAATVSGGAFAVATSNASGVTTAAVAATNTISLASFTTKASVQALVGKGMTVNGTEVQFYDGSQGAYTGSAKGIDISSAINSTGTIANDLTSTLASQLSTVPGITATAATSNLSISAATAGAAGNSINVTDGGVQKDFQAIFQIGANTGQTMTVSIKDMRSQALNISGTTASGTITAKNGSIATLTAVQSASDGTSNTNTEYTLDLSTAANATAAVSVIDDATAAVSAERSNLGAVQNRLEHTINNLGTSSQNITTAEANIRDVDMASEMTNFQKNNILQQAAQAMLAQANQQGQGVLQLLR